MAELALEGDGADRIFKFPTRRRNVRCRDGTVRKLSICWRPKWRPKCCLFATLRRSSEARNCLFEMCRIVPVNPASARVRVPHTDRTRGGAMLGPRNRMALEIPASVRLTELDVSPVSGRSKTITAAPRRSSHSSWRPTFSFVPESFVRRDGRRSTSGKKCGACPLSG